MNKLILALALVPALFTSSAFAQTVPDAVATELWCGTALTVAFSNPPPDATSEQMGQAQTFIDGGNAMISEATQKYLDAGVTEEQVTKTKTDLVAEITPIVTGTGDASKAKHTFDECAQLLPGGAPAAPAADASAAPAAPADTSAAPPAADASSSAAQ
jgi:hypothetical protein